MIALFFDDVPVPLCSNKPLLFLGERLTRTSFLSLSYTASGLKGRHSVFRPPSIPKTPSCKSGAGHAANASWVQCPAGLLPGLSRLRCSLAASDIPPTAQCDSLSFSLRSVAIAFLVTSFKCSLRTTWRVSALLVPHCPFRALAGGHFELCRTFVTTPLPDNGRHNTSRVLRGYSQDSPHRLDAGRLTWDSHQLPQHHLRPAPLSRYPHKRNMAQPCSRRWKQITAG